MSKYDVDSAETQYQPDSGDNVLLNKLGITSIEEMNDIESILLAQLYGKLFSDDAHDLPTTFQTITTWHRWWLANVYDWAGKTRNVNMSKGGFLFTAPSQIAKCLDTFEEAFLTDFSQLPHMSRDDLVTYMARSHIEFILIHPFREGNGRISRLLMDVMSHQAGYGLLDYTLWDKHKDFYIASIQAGVGQDYQYMEKLVRDILIG
jgi:cell filamentation protein